MSGAGGRIVAVRRRVARSAAGVTPRQARWIVDGVTAGVIVSVAVALAGLTWRLAGEAGTAAPAIVPVAAVPVAAVDPAAAIGWAPFGAMPAAADAAPVPTALPLELRGIISANPASLSTALIAPTGGRALPYAVGAAVGGATVAAIQRDRVILSVNGRQEVLGFPRASGPETGGGTIVAVPVAVPVPVPVAAPAPAAGGAAAAIAMLGATPTGQGYRIGTPPAAAATAAGLAPGDVIVALNGVPLGDAARDAKTFAAVQGGGGLRIDVQRGARRLTLALPGG